MAGVEITNRSLERTPLPYPQFYILLFIRFIEPISFTLLFPFVYFMVRDFHLTDDPNQIGFYAGFVASSFAVAEFLSGVPWGMLSDKIGRRPVIILGLFGTMISMTLFGLSKSLAWAMVTRFMAGSLSGNVGVLKTVIGEMTDRSNRAEGFSYITMSFALGYIVGPSLGGFLSHPVEKFPVLFGSNLILTPFLSEYPYFLPCFVASCCCLIGLIVAYIYLEETFDKKPIATPIINSESSSTTDYGSISSKNSNCSEIIKEKVEISSASWIVITSYVGLSLFSVILEELFPFWAATSISRGGLGYDSSQIGMTITLAGAILIIMQLIIFPYLQRQIGTLNIYRNIFLIYAPVILLFPIAGTLIRQGYPQLSWIAILITYNLRTCCGVAAFTAFNILLPESCPSKSILGKVNGIAQALGSLARGIGPSLCGYMFSWSLGNHLPFPFDHHLTFYFASILALGTYFLVRRIQPDMVMY